MTVGYGFQLNFKSGKPVYLQVVDQVKAAVASGAARAGDPLPSIRPLAEELRVNRNTIAKAYAELESQGVIETSPGRAVSSPAAGVSAPQRRARQVLTEEIDEAVVQAHHLQVDKDEFLRLAEERFDSFARKRARCRRRQGMMPMTPDTPAIDITDLRPALRPHRRRQRPEPARRARPLLRLLRPQRRRQNDDDQVPAESAAADRAASVARLRDGSGEARSRRQDRGSRTCPTRSASIRG